MGILSQAHRGAIEFAGGQDFEEGAAIPFLRWTFAVDGQPFELSSTSMAWQRVCEWLPTFSATIGAVVVKGTIFAPCGRTVDFPGFVYAITIENRASNAVTIAVRGEGTLGARSHRIRHARLFNDDHAASIADDVITLSGTSPGSDAALAIAGDAMVPNITSASDSVVHFDFARTIDVAANATADVALYVAAGPECEGAVSMVNRMRRHGWKSIARVTRESLAAMQQSTGVPAADRLINRHLMFACFYAAGRAIDDARWYLFRSRAPWAEQGFTVRDFEALMWVAPALQLAESSIGRESLLRICELHGYAPGRGVNYIDGTPFDLSFCLDAAAAYPLAVDRYVGLTGDDRIVEEAPIAESLYAANDDIAAARHSSLPLYRTESAPSGNDAVLPYTLHGNALVAEALAILRQTLDEKTAADVQPAEPVRAAIMRHFASDKDSSRTLLATAVDLDGATSMIDDPVATAYWLPVYHLLSRDDSIYRRTIRSVQAAGTHPGAISLAARCATLIGPDADKTLDWLRRADLDFGFAAEFLDEDGRAIANGGDASLSGLIAYSVWYAVTVLGAKVH